MKKKGVDGRCSNIAEGIVRNTCANSFPKLANYSSTVVFVNIVVFDNVSINERLPVHNFRVCLTTMLYIDINANYIRVIPP